MVARFGFKTRLRVGVGVRVSVGFKDSVGAQSGQKFPLGALSAHGASGTFDAHALPRVAPLTTSCWPKAPLRRGGSSGEVVVILGIAESTPPCPSSEGQKQYRCKWGGGGADKAMPIDENTHDMSVGATADCEDGNP